MQAPALTERPVRPPRRRAVARSRTTRITGSRPDRRPLELDRLAASWHRALDADERALAAATGTLTAAELGRRRSELAEERRRTADALGQLAATAYVHPRPWLAPMAVTPRMLGLPDGVTTCLFDLDGVLTDSGVLHAWAWAAAFDGFLQRVSERNGWHFIPFDREADYLAFIDGRPRLEGVHMFLASRGIRLPEGRPEDRADAETAHGLARRKSEALARRMHRRGVTAVAGARRYLEAAGQGGLNRGIVSASANTLSMLELAGLATLVDDHVDAELMRIENLRSRPAPDLLDAACRRFDVDPATAVTFTPAPAGVAAGLAAGLVVVGVGAEARAEILQGFGAERVVPSLDALLDRRLRETGQPAS
jgi:beta-phosphoglucomutase-like phosphatase (HAD superfamily)